MLDSLVRVTRRVIKARIINVLNRNPSGPPGFQRPRSTARLRGYLVARRPRALPERYPAQKRVRCKSEEIPRRAKADPSTPRPRDGASSAAPKRRPHLRGRVAFFPMAHPRWSGNRGAVHWVSARAPGARAPQL